MAVTKIVGAIHPSQTGNRHGSMKRLIDYVLNAKKTDGGRLAGAMNCRRDHALEDMVATKQYYGKDSSDKRNRQMYHFVISWPVDDKDITHEKAFEVIREFVRRYLKNEYEAVYSVHKDKDHVHGHVAFNSVSFRDGIKYTYTNGDWAKSIQPLVDEICKEMGLHTLSEDTGQTIEEYEEERLQRKSRYRRGKMQGFNDERDSHSNNKYHKDSDEKYSWNEHLRADIDHAILQSHTYEEFEQFLKDIGYKIKYGNSEYYGPNMKLKAPGMSIYRRTYQLGAEYTLPRIKERIEIKDKPLPVYVIPVNMRIVIPVRFFVKYRKIPLNPSIRRYYRFLYRIGIQPTYSKRSYQDIKAAVEKAQRAEKKLKLCFDYMVVDKESAKKLLTDMESRLNDAKEAQTNILKKHEPYKKMLGAYNRAKRLKADYDAYNAGDLTKQDLAQKYESAVNQYQKYGFDDAQIEEYKIQRKAEFKNMKKRIKDAEFMLELAKELAEEYDIESTVEFTKEEEDFYRSIPTDNEEIDKPKTQVGVRK